MFATDTPWQYHSNCDDSMRLRALAVPHCSVQCAFTAAMAANEQTEAHASVHTSAVDGQSVRDGAGAVSAACGVASGAAATATHEGQVEGSAPTVVTGRSHDSPWWLERKLCRLLYDHTCVCMCSCFFVMLLMTGIVAGGGLMVLSTPTDYDWAIASSAIVQRLDAAQDASSKADPVAAAGTGVERKDFSWNEAIVVTYTDVAGATSSSIFTPSNLAEMCVIENMMLAHPQYRKFCALDANDKCKPQPRSVLRYFYAQQTLSSWGYGPWSCQPLSEVSCVTVSAPLATPYVGCGRRDTCAMCTSTARRRC